MNLKTLAKATLAVSLATLISGCSLFPREPEKEIVIQTEYIEKTVPLQGAPKPMTLNDVRWYVVTEENFQEFIETYEKENGEPYVFYALSVRSYESMALNMAELKRYIQQQQAIIIYYENALRKREDEEVLDNSLEN